MNRFSFSSLITLLLIIALGSFVAYPQHAMAEALPPNGEGATVAKSSAESWKKVRYENWTINVPTNKVKRCADKEKMLKQHDLPVTIFSYLMWRESRCNSKSINAIWKNGKIVWTLNSDGSYDSGLMQINSSWKTVTSQVCRTKYGDMKVLFNPDCNLQVAKFLLDNGGLSHWGGKKSY